MRKHMGMYISFLFLSAMSVFGVGSAADNRNYDDGATRYEQNTRSVRADVAQRGYPRGYRQAAAQGQAACPKPCPVTPPPCCEEPLCKIPVRCKHPNENRLQCFDFITVTARNPRMCILGEQYPLDFDVHACDDVCDVTVTTHLPEGVSYIKSQPEAQVEGRKLTWFFGSMSKGECRPAKILLRCECEGEQCVCFCATATPVRFCSLLCAKPILVCHKCGPEQACPGDPVNYTITVTNRGSCAAEEVVVTDNVPPELEHASCARTLTYKLGCLQPCETKTINVCLTAVKRGNACNTVVVSACNADSVSCQACTCVCCCAVALEKTGSKEVPIGKNADYQIVAVNTGDITLTDVVVTDCAPSSTSIVAAEGAQLNGNQAVWRLREMKPGERVTFNITLTTCVPGCTTNRVSLTNCQNCNACAEATTRWRGRPALDVCTTGGGAICVGERTSYAITVTNQGSEMDSNVNVVVRFPNGLTPVAGSGATCANVSGQTVTFAPAASLRPHQTLTYRVDAEAKAVGDARVMVEVSSDTIRTPITEQESTIVN